MITSIWNFIIPNFLKRRLEDTQFNDQPDRKIRRIGEGASESSTLPVRNFSKEPSCVVASCDSESGVYIGTWTHNKENRPQIPNTVMKRHTEVVLVPESSTGFRGRQDSDVEVLEERLSPHLVLQQDNDVEVLSELPRPSFKQDGSSRKSSGFRSARSIGRYCHEVNQTRKPFKVREPPEHAPSTPITWSNSKMFCSSPKLPSPNAPVQLLPTTTSRLANGNEGRLHVHHYRSQSSILSTDSNNSRGCNTLAQERHAEENAKYSEILKRASGLSLHPDRPRIYQNGIRNSSQNHSGSRSSRETSVRLSLDETTARKNVFTVGTQFSSAQNSPSVLNIKIDRKHELQPLTSAGRRQPDDDEPKIIHEGSQLKHANHVHQVDVIEEITNKYAERGKAMAEQAASLHKLSELCAERSKLTQQEMQRKAEQNLLDSLHSLWRITESVAPDEDVEEIPPLPELTPDMTKEIDRALSAPNDKVLVDAFNITIKGRDIRTLSGLSWLNDEIINFYMNLLIERGKTDKYPSVYAFNTFFYPKLISTGYQTLKRWTRRVDVFANEYLLVPVHLGMHWCMAIIDMKEKVIRYYDSMNGKNKQCLDALLQYLEEESMDKKKVPFDVTGWRKETVNDIPQQMNGSDCGMFSCMYAEYVVRRARITFTQDDMPYFRKKMVYEILKAKLLC